MGERLTFVGQRQPVTPMPKKRPEPTESDLPRAIGQPAMRAFALAGLTRLEHFTRVGERELLAMHGVGPKAIEVLRRALADRGQTFD
jgi:hypothetical protein